MQEESVYAEGEREAQRYRWIESEKAGRDLGEQAVHEWVGQHWSGYCRARFIEHLRGKRCWVEFDRNDFGLLQRQFRDTGLLVDRIMDRVTAGRENLDIICWALDWGLDTGDVIAVLESLDINKRRLAFRALSRA